MRKIAGILALLVAICLFSALTSEYFLTAFNIENLLRRSALFAIISIGAGIVIMGRGIDLSIGSVVCLVGILTPWLLTQHHWSPWLVLPAMLALSIAIGVAHGLLITKLKLQPFIVTLCGLLIYRGIARGITADQTQGFGGAFATLRYLANGRIPISDHFGLPMPLILLVVIAALAIVFLQKSIYGRYLLAIGRNEQAARYSGVDTARITTASYAICSLLAGLGGLLFVADVGSAQPVDFGNFYELYAIAAAVLGGCSLRGGEGSIIGIVIGAAVMQVLRNTITLTDWIPDTVEYAVIGAVILAGVIADEGVRAVIARRRRLKRIRSERE